MENELKPCIECGETDLLSVKAKLETQSKLALLKWRGEGKCLNCGHFVLTYGLYKTEQEAVNKVASLWNKERHLE